MIKLAPALRDKKLIVFDLDGTITETKFEMDAEMSRLISELLEVKKVAVIGGGKYELFKTQFIKRLKCPRRLLGNLFLFPTTSTSFYRYKGGWKKVYTHALSKSEKKRIKRAFTKAFKITKYEKPKKTYGKVVEDRGTQITFSALGQEIVSVLGKKGVALKKRWRDEHTDVKLKLARTLQKLLPDLEVRAAGYTSIDVTKKGIDKAYGLRQIEKHLHIPIKDMVFVGDALFPGGNDYAARRTGVKCVEVKGPEETKKVINFILSD